MKQRILSWVMVSVLFMGIAGVVRADDDARIMGKLGLNLPDHMRQVSIFAAFRGDKDNSLPAVAAGNETRFYSKVWDGLYLQVISESGENGAAGYLFSFSKDESNLIPVTTNESRDVPTLRELSAMDFRSDDNFSARPLKPGLGTPDDRGALRLIHYADFDVEIRVLEFRIADAVLKKKPYFKSVSCLVTVTEKAPVK